MQTREEAAQLIFDKAIEVYMAKDFQTTKYLLDSIISHYPDVENSTIEAKDMKKIVEKTEYAHNKMYLDSLLEEREREMSKILDRFYVEDPNAMPPVFAHKSQSAYSASSRSHLRAYTDINGVFYMSSNYTGEGRIYHNCINIKIKDDIIVTDSISAGPCRHNFENNGMVWEIVKYKQGSDNGVASYIANNINERIDVIFVGQTPTGRTTNYRIILTETDKKAIRDTYQLSALLHDIAEIKTLAENLKK
jgi:hypothetical protein